MRWYEWLFLWLAFFVPCAIIVPALSQAGSPLRPYPALQWLIIVFVPVVLTLLIGFTNILFGRKRNR